MKNIVIIAFLILISLESFSQQINSLKDDEKLKDSIALLIKTSKNDSLKSYYGFRLASLYKKDNQIEKFEEYLKIGNRFSNKYPYLKDCSGYYNALKNLNQANIDLFFKEIYSTRNKLKKYHFKESYELQAMILQNMAIYYDNNGDSQKAMQLLIEEAIPMAKKSNNSIMLGSLYKTIGIRMMENSERIKADFYFQKAIQQFDSKQKDSPIYKEEKLAIQIITAENLLDLGKLTEAKKLLDKAYLILIKHKNSNMNEQFYYSNGYYYYKSQKYENAIQNYDIGIKLALLKNNSFTTRLKLGKYDALFALENYKEAYGIISDLIKAGYLTIDEKIFCYLELSKTLVKLGEYKKASYYSQKYIRINDSLVKENSKNEILRLEAKFKNSENENKIKQLKIQKDKVALVAQNYRMRYITFASIFGVLAILLFFIVASFKNKNKLAQAIDLKNKQEINFLKTQKEIEVMQAMINGEEAERKRIARDLHDGIGSRLSALKMQFQDLTEDQNKSNEFANFNEMLSTAIIDLRQIAFNLMPETLIKLGLELALQDLCHTLATEKIAIVFQSSQIDKNISESNQITIFRIIQELINNALKHSKCTEIIVDCNQNNNLFLITVEDNGIGIDSNAIENFSGLGLKNLKNRIDILNGTLEIKNSNKSGTVINIELCL
jgi:two-component system, NarL family, sensor kinase